MSFTFTEKTELEQLHLIEREAPHEFEVEMPSPTSGTSFNAWLGQRLNAFKGEHKNQSILGQAPSYYKRAKLALVALGTFAGFVSVKGLLTSSQEEVNIFWLLSAVLGTHSIALLLWMVSILLLRSNNPGPISSILEWLIKRISHLKPGKPIEQAAMRAWWQTNLSPALRTWQLSALTHLFWFALLAGSTLGLFISFTTQQYDFIWESTLLSKRQLQDVLNIISQPAQFIGFQLPSATHDAADQRKLWATFVLSSLVIYGLFPRFIALLFANSILTRKQKKWQIDFAQSYYIHLQRIFFDEQNRSQILDPDNVESSSHSMAGAFSAEKPPADAHWYGLEVNPAVNWSERVPQLQTLLNDQKSFDELQPKIQTEKAPAVIFVEGHRLPDRGTQRKLKSLQATHIWLAITHSKTLSSEKLQGWLDVVNKMQWDQNRVLLMRLGQ